MIVNMKKTITLFLLTFLYLSSFSQINLDKKITIVAKNKQLSEIIDEISNKANINFSYSSQQINSEQKITFIARNKPTKIIINQLFTDCNIDYIILEKQIILKAKQQEIPSEIIENDTKPKIIKYTISGYLKDEKTGEVLIGATIFDKKKRVGTATNGYGFYSLTLPTGNYNLEYSYIGYNKKNIEVKLFENQKISQSLELNENVLSIVSIPESSSSDILEMNSIKSYKLSSDAIVKRPLLGGEFDAVKTLQSIAGISSYGDGSVIFNVRGGDKGQNLIFIDEAPIYNPSHLLGFFSAIAPDVINDIKIYKSDFPIQYGGRLSSMIDVRTKDGSMKSLGFSGNISPLMSSYSFDSPLKKDHSSVLFALRNSHVNWLLEDNFPNLDIKFYDFHAKLNFKPSRKNRIYFSFYAGSDILKLNNQPSSSAMAWKNITGTFRWNHLFSDKMFSNTILYFSRYDYFLYSSYENEEYWSSLIGNFSFKNDYSYFANPKNTFRFGFSANTHIFNPGNLNNEYFERKVFASNAIELVSYFGHEIKLKNWFAFFYGIRFLNWNNIGPSVVFNYDENYQPVDIQVYGLEKFNSFFNTEPQMNLTFAVNKTLSFKASYSHNVQYLQYLSNSVSPFTTVDVWLPASPNIQPQKANQFVLGAYKKFAEYSFTTEFFYKKMKNQIDYIDHADMYLNPLLEGELRFGAATASGIEFALQKQKGDFTMNLNYTYSRVLKQTDGVNFNNKYWASYDKPHNININLAYKATSRWFLTANWVYSSGNRFSSPTSFYYYQNYTVPIYLQKNNDKLPDYHRLDISAKFRLNKNESRKYVHYLTISIFNFYGRKNPVAVNFNKIEGENNTFYTPANYIYDNQLIATSVNLLGFVPSVSYQFKFR